MVEIIVKFTFRVPHAVQISLSHLVNLDEFPEKVALSLYNASKTS